MKISKILTLGVITITIALPVFADMFSPSHSCSKPYKPYEFNSQWELDNFNNDVENYKRCISNFIDEQNEETENHREAASGAIDEWNNYANYELN